MCVCGDSYEVIHSRSISAIILFTKWSRRLLEIIIGYWLIIVNPIRISCFTKYINKSDSKDIKYAIYVCTQLYENNTSIGHTSLDKLAIQRWLGTSSTLLTFNCAKYVQWAPCALIAMYSTLPQILSLATTPQRTANYFTATKYICLHNYYHDTSYERKYFPLMYNFRFTDSRG